MTGLVVHTYIRTIIQATRGGTAGLNHSPQADIRIMSKHGLNKHDVSLPLCIVHSLHYLEIHAIEL
jgi:hypothetical protein